MQKKFFSKAKEKTPMQIFSNSFIPDFFSVRSQMRFRFESI